MVECSLNDTNPCEVHCQVPNRPNTCKSSTELEALFAEPIFRSPGAPCDMKLEVCKYKDWSEKNETDILVCSSGMAQPIFNYFTDLKSAQNFREIEY